MFSISLHPLAANAAESDVYKTVDKEGNVLFTDVPPDNSLKTKKIHIQEPNTGTVLGDSPVDDASDGQENMPLTYDTLRIASPAPDETVRKNVGNIAVKVDVAPALSAEHELQIVLEGVAGQWPYPTRISQRHNREQARHQGPRLAPISFLRLLCLADRR
jgi:hypothetical protein